MVWLAACCSRASRSRRAARTTTSRSACGRSSTTRDLTPAQIVARVEAGGGFGFLAHPFSKGSERFKRGGSGMPWGDLDAEGYTGIELWSFVTDSAERVNSIRELLSFIAAPSRFLDHPPPSQPRRVGPPLRAAPVCRARRRGRPPGRHPRARARAAAADGLQALVPVPAHAPARARAAEHVTSTQTAQRCSARCARATRTSRSTRWRRRAAFASGRTATRVLEMGDEAHGGSWTLRRARHRSRHACACCATARRWRRRRATRSSTTPTHPGVYRVEAYRDAHGRERTWILSNPIYLRAATG